MSSVAWGQAVLHEFEGTPNPHDGFGAAVADVGDINGDGRSDILVCAPERTDGAGNQLGAAVLFSGSDGHVLRTHYGAVHGERMGNSAAGTGDLDGDGIGDYAVGAAEADYGGVDSGSIYYFSGTNGAQIRRVDGDVPGTLFGLSLCSLGDVDLDGVPDQAAGGWSTPAKPAFVRAFSGASGATLFTLTEPLPAFTPYTIRVAGIGDTNGDSVADLAIGSPGVSGTQGQARIVSGGDGSLLRILPTSGGESGTGMAAAGDVDGDGMGDVIVGAPWDGPSGRVSVFSGASGSVLRTFEGEEYGQRFGQTVARCDDLDGDGVGEYVVSAIWANPSGNHAGRVRVLSGSVGRTLYAFDGDDSGSNLGASLATLGDVNGDGVGDLVLGQPKAQPGSVKVFSGTCSSPAGTTYCTGKVNSVGPGATIGYLGSTSLSAGDFTLTVDGCPPGTIGLFIRSTNEAQIPLGNGLLCLTGQTVHRMPPFLVTSAAGTASLPIKFSQPPMQFIPGANPKFQFWYRDPAGGGTGSNTSNALSVTVCP
jgi:hypothetical protein